MQFVGQPLGGVGVSFGGGDSSSNPSPVNNVDLSPGSNGGDGGSSVGVMGNLDPFIGGGNGYSPPPSAGSAHSAFLPPGPGTSRPSGNTRQASGDSYASSGEQEGNRLPSGNLTLNLNSTSGMLIIRNFFHDRRTKIDGSTTSVDMEGNRF